MGEPQQKNLQLFAKRAPPKMRMAFNTVPSETSSIDSAAASADPEGSPAASSIGGIAASKKKISKTKLQAFAAPVLKKTAFQRQKEEAEARKKKEDEEAARVYDDFVASFDDDNRAPKAFVKAGTMMPHSVFDDDKAANSKGKSSKGSLYMPMSFIKAGEQKPKPAERNSPEPHGQKQGKKRNMDAFLEELMREQEEREDRMRRKQARSGDGPDNADQSGRPMLFEDRGGSFDTGDPTTTNLYVGNINPQVDEDTMCRHFGVYGAIASVKIMWPRTQEERDRNRNCGFIAFMNRSDAASALKDMDGFDLDGYAMRVGWGKAVPVPDQPIFTLDKNRLLPSGLPFNATSVGATKPAGAFSAMPPPSAIAGSRNAQGPRLEVRVSRPTDFETIRKIHHTVERLMKHGAAFELLLMREEKDNPDFAFLFSHDHPDHVYYRWRLYSMLQGDTKSNWRTEPFYMFDQGPIWVPPEEPREDEDCEIDLDMSEEESERALVPKGTLGKKSRARLELLLLRITTCRGDIAKVMAFAFDHLDAADEVMEVITKSLLIIETPTPTKIARLYLLSDILHNSSMPIPNAWKYRAGFEGKLPDIFDHLNQVYRGIASRLKAEQFRKQVAYVLSVWTNWIVFAHAFIDSLGEIFQRRLKTQLDETTPSAADLSPKPASGMPTAPANEEDLDGVPMKQKPRWRSVTAGSDTSSFGGGAMGADEEEEDIDGVPMAANEDGEDEDDIDGVPMKLTASTEERRAHEAEDIDGVPLAPGGSTLAADEDDVDDMFA